MPEPGFKWNRKCVIGDGTIVVCDNHYMDLLLINDLGAVFECREDKPCDICTGNKSLDMYKRMAERKAS